MPNEMHEANRKRWDAVSDEWAAGADSRGIWRRCVAEPCLVLSEYELAHLDSISGKKVCVLGSGDNQVAFAIAGMGANVTSVDISQRQLDVARRRSSELGLQMEFALADVTDLSPFPEASFDLVYTGGHVAVWISDLKTYYAEASRILRPQGIFMIAEYHPFRRIWRTSKNELSIEYPYADRGPFEYHVDASILHPKPGRLKSYEFHWTVSDLINAVIEAGCGILEVQEFGEDVADWEGSPMQGLPEYLLIVARKN